jgi:3-dehydroquinate synthase
MYAQVNEYDMALPAIQQKITLNFSYPVHFTEGLFHLQNTLVARLIGAGCESKSKKVLIIIDTGVLRCHKGLISQINAYAKRYSNIITMVDRTMLVPGGEAAKNDSYLIEQVHSLINKVRLSCNSYILAIGGGAVLDMVGYAAATANRGINLIKVPTTVLAQSNSGASINNSVNAFGKKNFLGVMAPPVAVINDFNFLTTLSDEDWRSGIAEAIKVALIKDNDFFNFITTKIDALVSRDINAMQQVIYRCAQLHLAHAATSDGDCPVISSPPLYFGHWAAHKLEQLTYYKLRHGEAVAIGIALDCTYSYILSLLSRLEWQRILNTLQLLGFTVYISELSAGMCNLEDPRCIFQGLEEYSESLGGNLSITLLESIGRGLEVSEVNIAIYREAINLLKNKF